MAGIPGDRQAFCHGHHTVYPVRLKMAVVAVSIQ
jgi:hypothetical protein